VDTEELDPKPVFDSLRRRWALILLLAAAGVLSALAITKFFMQPVYRSTARVIIESGQPAALTPAGTIPLAADTYVELVRGEWLKREVAQKLGLGASDRLPFELDARSVRGTQMVVLEAESADPKIAAQAASATLSVLQEVVRQRQAERFAAAEQRLESQINELAAELGRVRAALAQARSEAERSNFQDQLTRLQAALGQLQASYGNLKLAQAQSGDLIVVLEPPAVPDRPVRPSLTLNSAVGGSLGLLLGVAYGAAVAFLDRRFRTLREVEAALGLPVLASVYRGEPATEGG
jgi:capsular polysaccharide biosynthesis protein